MKTESIRRIVKASGVTAGETVLIHFWGEDTDKAIANDFIASVASLGATPIFLQQARTINCAIFQNARAECFGDAYFEMFSKFDAVLDVFTYRPIVLGHKLEAEQMALYRKYISNLFYALMKAKHFTQIRIPTAANAEESSLEPAEYVRRMEAAYDISYDELLTECIATKESMECHEQYILRTGEGCELRFDLTDRQWHIDAGDGDWPCGEIYIAPVEDKTNGSLFFEKLYIEDVGVFECVTLTVADGRIVGSNRQAIAAFIQSLSSEETVVCELGLGMNPNITDTCGYTVLDEKMADSFHIAIGANKMFGGRNKAKIHIDFVNEGPFELLPVK